MSVHQVFRIRNENRNHCDVTICTSSSISKHFTSQTELPSICGERRVSLVELREKHVSIAYVRFSNPMHSNPFQFIIYYFRNDENDAIFDWVYMLVLSDCVVNDRKHIVCVCVCVDVNQGCENIHISFRIVFNCRLHGGVNNFPTLWQARIELS